MLFLKADLFTKIQLQINNTPNFKRMRQILTLLFCATNMLLWAQQSLPMRGYKYFVGNEEPPTEWKNINFDDSDWNFVDYSIKEQSSAVGYGYGTGNDRELIDTTTSVYVRISFEIGLDTIDGLQMAIDFDDGFVAYINGVEVARANLGVGGQFISHSQLADRSREAVFHRDDVEFIRPFYYFPEDSLNKCLREGTNILSVQVHNDSVNGSDLSLYCWLSTISTSLYTPYLVGKQSVFLDSTFLPIVIIETDEYGVRRHKTNYPARLGIIHNNQGYNYPTDSFNIFDGYAEIKTRGQSSLHWPKTSFNIELKNKELKDTNVAILHLPSEEDWVLFGPLADRSLIRNKLMYELAEQLGHYAPRSFFCELIYNGEYYGLYQFLEKIKRDTNRVAIKKLTSKDTEGTDITGGYIFKYDKEDSRTGDKEGVPNLVYPKNEDITLQQLEYIDQFFANYKASLKNENLFDPEKGYRNFVDSDSYIDFTLLNELCRNPDAYKYSTYFYKDRDDINPRLQFGPLWDFDLAMGNSTFQNGDKIQGWQFLQATNSYLNHRAIFKDSLLVDQLKERWLFLRKDLLSNETINKKIDSLADFLGNRVQKNFEVWVLEGKNLAMFGQEYTFATSYELEIKKMKSWMNSRMNWMDENIDKVYIKYVTPVHLGVSDMVKNNIAIYPTLCNETLHCQNSNNLTVSYELTSLFGQVLKVETDQIGLQTIDIDISDIANGIYLMNVYSDNVLISSSKIIKQ